MADCSRRQFVHLAAAAASLVPAPRSSRAADARIEVLPGERIGPVTADLHGHFIEHLGGVVYDGVWVVKARACRTPAASGRRCSITCDDSLRE